MDARLGAKVRGRVPATLIFRYRWGGGTRTGRWKQRGWARAARASFGPGGVITISSGRVTGPDGFALQYDRPRREGDELWFNYGRYPHKVYGAKLLENIIQFLARQIIRNVALRLMDKGLRFVLQAHDELVFIVPDAEVDKAKKIIHMEMIRRPTWAPDLPLKADVGAASHTEKRNEILPMAIQSL